MSTLVLTRLWLVQCLLSIQVSILTQVSQGEARVAPAGALSSVPSAHAPEWSGSPSQSFQICTGGQRHVTCQGTKVAPCPCNPA